MVEFKNPEPEVVKPGECIDLPKHSREIFYTIFYHLAWLRYNYKVNFKIVRHYYQNICTCTMYNTVAVAALEKGNKWGILYDRLHEIGQRGTFDDTEPVESVCVEFSSDESVAIVICLAPKEEK